MTSTNPITEDRPLAWTTPDGRYTITIARTVEAYAITVENAAGFRVDALARTFGNESAARDLARRIATMLRDGATVEQVVAAIQPAADLISEVTAHLALVAEARKLSPAQRTAILDHADADGHIARGNGVRLDTLEALETLHLGTRTKVGYRTTGLTLNGRGRQIAEYLNANRNPIAA